MYRVPPTYLPLPSLLPPSLLLPSLPPPMLEFTLVEPFTGNSLLILLEACVYNRVTQ